MNHVSIRAIILSGLFALGTVYSTMGGARAPNAGSQSVDREITGNAVKPVTLWNGAALVPVAKPNVITERSGRMDGGIFGGVVRQ